MDRSYGHSYIGRDPCIIHMVHSCQPSQNKDGDMAESIGNAYIYESRSQSADLRKQILTGESKKQMRLGIGRSKNEVIGSMLLSN